MNKLRIMVKKQEIRASALVGGKRHPASGALFFAKGDGSGKNYTIECKRTDKKSITIKAEYLDKITQEASSTGRMPLVHFELPTVGPLTSKDWILLEADLFERLSEGGERC
ncbi:MAG: hypothetical protein HQK96_05560 [Nitrospirae bacterium]|nr:hypothetical protein [Nitrospirota bacterium]